MSDPTHQPTSPCPNCGTVVAADTEWCPECGARVTARPMTARRFLTLILLAILALGLGVAGMCAVLLGGCLLFMDDMYGGKGNMVGLLVLGVALYVLTWITAKAFVRNLK
jgi:hypothetical protein